MLLLALEAAAATRGAAAAVLAVAPGGAVDDEGGSGGDVAVAFARRLWSSPALQCDAERNEIGGAHCNYIIVRPPS